MPKVSKAAAEANARDVLRAAGQVMRENGTRAATMASIAAKAKLTHGAVYSHFNDKNELTAAAIGADYERIISLLNSIQQKGGMATDYVNTYLGTGHRDHFDWGCPVAPLAAEIHRDASVVQAAFTNGMKKNIDALLELMGPNKTRSDAIVMLAILSGAMAMARATRHTDAELSQNILNAAKAALTELTSSSIRGFGGADSAIAR